MRINYRNYPTDYINELQATGKRLKARCFMEYYHDLQMDAVNSMGFYGVSWGTKEKAMSKGSVHKWIGEFVKEIERFHSAHILKNHQHHSRVKNQSERKVNGKCTKDEPQTTVTPSVVENDGTQSERQVNQDNNIYNNNKASDRLFNDLFFLYGMNTKFVGKKDDDAYSAYLEAKENVNYKDMSVAIMLYLHDEDRSGKFYNFKNFMKHETYYSYIPKKIRLLYDGQWIDGVYDSELEVFTSNDGFKGKLDSKGLTKKFVDGELEFIKEEAA